MKRTGSIAALTLGAVLLSTYSIRADVKADEKIHVYTYDVFHEAFLPGKSFDNVERAVQYQRHERDDPQQGVDEQQIDANVAVAAARNAGVVQDLEDRVGGPAERSDQHCDATIE